MLQDMPLLSEKLTRGIGFKTELGVREEHNITIVGLVQ
jgi:hypothetical protein